MTPQKPDSLLEALEVIRTHRFVDLTHPFAPGIPHWHGVPNEVRETLSHYDKGVGTQGLGFLIHRYLLAGQWGTHVDPQPTSSRVDAPGTRLTCGRWSCRWW